MAGARAGSLDPVPASHARARTNASPDPRRTPHLLPVAKLGHRGVVNRRALWRNRPVGLLSGGSGSLRCACRRPDPRPRASGLRSRSRGSSDERRRPRRCWTRRICTAPSNSPTSSLCLCTGSAQTMTVPSSGGSPFASRRPGSSSRRRFAFHEQAALWNACVARLETTASGHREPRERRGRQMPAPARRQGSRAAIQDTPYSPEREPRSPIVDAGRLHMHHRPRAASSRRQARLWVAREASARDEALAAPTRRGFPALTIRWRRASGDGGVNRRSDRQRRSALAFPSVAKHKPASAVSGERSDRQLSAAASRPTGS